MSCDRKSFGDYDDWCDAHPMNQLKEENESLEEQINEVLK